MTAPTRVYHTWDKWECYPAGFYEVAKDGMEEENCKLAYRDFLADHKKFRVALDRVLKEWPKSTEHYLTNERMNRIAWLGQAAACIALGIPARFRSGYFLLTDEQRKSADLVALEYLNRWLNARGFDSVDLDGAGVSAKVNLY